LKSLFIPLFLSLVLFGCGAAQKQSAMLPSAISNPGVWRCADARTSTHTYSFVTWRNYAVRGR
jgi:hypothetical protein